MASLRPQSAQVTPVVGFILVSNLLVYILQRTTEWQLIANFALWPIHDSPYRPDFRPWQVLTYGWLHGNNAHIFVNMFAVWMFGKTIEQVWGSRRFAFYYLVCVVGAGLVQLFVTTRMAAGGDLPAATVGASGGVFGLLLAFALLFPNQMIVLLIPPIPMKAKYFVIAYGALELYLGFTRTDSGVAHFAHLGGMLFGFILIRYWVFQRKRKLNRESDPPD